MRANSTTARGTSRPSDVSTTSTFSHRYACDNVGLCVRRICEADEALSFVLNVIFYCIINSGKVALFFKCKLPFCRVIS